jgi:hypothetical protein
MEWSDKDKVAIPEQPRKVIIENYGELMEKQEALRLAQQTFQNAQTEFTKAGIAFDISRRAFGEFLNLCKKRLNVPLDWDMTNEAEFFFDNPNEKNLIPPDMKAMVAPEPPTEEQIAAMEAEDPTQAGPLNPCDEVFEGMATDEKYQAEARKIAGEFDGQPCDHGNATDHAKLPDGSCPNDKRSIPEGDDPGDVCDKTYEK